MMKNFIALILLVVSANCAICQDTLYYLNSDFETIEDQQQWVSDPSDLVVKWEYKFGGFAKPLQSYSDSNNAILYRAEEGEFYEVMLISPSIDLSVAVTPRLKFHYAQAKSLFGQDELTLFFKAGVGADWDSIEHYGDRQDDWVEELYDLDSIDLGDPDKYLVEGFQIGFRGKANSGQGSVIDLVTITEEAEVPKYIKDFTINYNNPTVIPSGSTIPIFGFELYALGNTGQSKLDSLSFNLSSGNDSWFKSNSFKLYATPSSVYKNEINDVTTQIGSDVSISNNKVVFTNIDYDLELGRNYFWISTGISNSAPHDATISFAMDSGAVHAVDTALPASGISNIFSGTIRESVFFDDFETDKSWELQGDFERTHPKGKTSISGKQRDPDYAFSDSLVIGTDLTVDGRHADTIVGTNAYAAITPMIDLLHYNQVKISMQSWFDFSSSDRATIQVSTNGGNDWQTIWYNHLDLVASSTQWEELVFEETVSNIIQRNDSVMIKFSVDTTVDPSPGIGYNIDDFAVTANLLDTDIGITSILAPYDDCLGYNNDTVKVIFKNYAFQPTPANVPVYFALWGTDSIMVWDTIENPIAVNDSIIFTFSNLANFPIGDNYDNFTVGHRLPGDEDNSNDSIIKPLRIPNNITPSFTEDFEYEGGVWLANENSSWLWAEPDVSIGAYPGSPNAWILSPFGDYWNSDTSYVESSCYDFSNNKYNIVELSYWLVSEQDKDGFVVQYSINDGDTWITVDTSKYGADWGWYTDTVDALGQPGISGNNATWVEIKEMLPASIMGEQKVKFRVLWSSDDENSARGLAFDNFKVFNAPHDVGICHISIPKDTCLYQESESVTVSVKNYGYNAMDANDTIIIGIDFGANQPVIDTVLLPGSLAPDDSVDFTVNAGISVSTHGEYSVTAYTLVEDDPWYYNTNNDSLTKSFTIWELPDAMLIDTIESRLPDTVVLRANPAPKLSFVWGDLSTADTLKVNGSGTYYVTVTDSTHGCWNYDSTYVELLYNDVGIDSIISPISDCGHTDAEELTVRIRNFGTDSLIATDAIDVSIFVDDVKIKTETLVLSESLLEGGYIDYTFIDTTYDFSAIDVYQLKALTDFDGDTVDFNDTTYTTVNTYGYPSVDIGADTTANELSFTLDAGPGFEQYVWNTGDTTQQITTDTSGLFIITVYDINNCSDTDSAFINLKIRDLIPIEMLSPVTSCGGESDATISFTYRNNGNDTISIGDTIYLGYTINSSEVRYDTLETQTAIFPNQVVTHVFSDTVDITEVRTYNFEFITEIPGDLRTENDTIESAMITNNQPVVDFGELNQVLQVFDTVLDAGYGENYVYNWFPGDSTGQTYLVKYTGTYFVNVTDTLTGCSAGDTVFIQLDIIDYYVSDISYANNECLNNSVSGIEVELYNNTSWNRGDTAKFDLIYQLGNGDSYTQYYELEEIWPIRETRTFTLDSVITFDELGSVPLSVKVDYPGDLQPDNDSSAKLINVNENPDFAFASDTLTGDSPFILDAGAGYSSYLWFDGHTQRTYAVTKDSIYSVTVSNAFGCSASDSVYVDVNIVSIREALAGNVEVNIYPNPASDKFFVELKNEEQEEFWLDIISSNGQQIFHKWITAREYFMEYTTTDLPAGLYFIRISNETNQETYKVVIQ